MNTPNTPSYPHPDRTQEVQADLVIQALRLASHEAAAEAGDLQARKYAAYYLTDSPRWYRDHALQLQEVVTTHLVELMMLQELRRA